MERELLAELPLERELGARLVLRLGAGALMLGRELLRELLPMLLLELPLERDEPPKILPGVLRDELPDRGAERWRTIGGLIRTGFELLGAW